MLHRVLAFAIVCLTLGGCASMSAAQLQRLATQDDATCKSYGLSVGTNAYAQCRMTIGQNREDRDALNRMNMRNVGAYLMTQ